MCVLSSPLSIVHRTIDACINYIVLYLLLLFFIVNLLCGPYFSYPIHQVYHHTVGQNSNLLLNLAPNKTGNVPEKAMQLYVQLGQWIRSCYGQPDATAFAHNFTLVASVGSQGADRFILMEDQQFGQLVRTYEVLVDGKVVAEGTSIGHKRIQFFPVKLSPGARVQFVATSTLESLAPYVTLQLLSGAKC